MKVSDQKKNIEDMKKIALATVMAAKATADAALNAENERGKAVREAKNAVPQPPKEKEDITAWVTDQKNGFSMRQKDQKDEGDSLDELEQAFNGYLSDIRFARYKYNHTRTSSSSTAEEIAEKEKILKEFQETRDEIIKRSGNAEQVKQKWNRHVVEWFSNVSEREPLDEELEKELDSKSESQSEYDWTPRQCQIASYYYDAQSAITTDGISEKANLKEAGKLALSDLKPRTEAAGKKKGRSGSEKAMIGSAVVGVLMIVTGVALIGVTGGIGLIPGLLFIGGGLGCLGISRGFAYSTRDGSQPQEEQRSSSSSPSSSLRHIDHGDDDGHARSPSPSLHYIDHGGDGGYVADLLRDGKEQTDEDNLEDFLVPHDPDDSDDDSNHVLPPRGLLSSSNQTVFSKPTPAEMLQFGIKQLEKIREKYVEKVKNVSSNSQYKKHIAAYKKEVRMEHARYSSSIGERSKIPYNKAYMEYLDNNLRSAVVLSFST